MKNKKTVRHTYIELLTSLSDLNKHCLFNNEKPNKMKSRKLLCGFI